MNFASALVLVMLTAGCASSAASSAGAHAATLPSAAPAAASNGLPGERQQVELRHFYLLSSGPNPTLVVTRAEVPDSNHAREHAIGNLHQQD